MYNFFSHPLQTIPKSIGKAKKIVTFAEPEKSQPEPKRVKLADRSPVVLRRRNNKSK
jgi:hypothetical protein